MSNQADFSMSENNLQSVIDHCRGQDSTAAFVRMAYVDGDHIAILEDNFKLAERMKGVLSQHVYEEFGLTEDVWISQNGTRPEPDISPERVEALKEHTKRRKLSYLLSQTVDDEGNAQCLNKRYSGLFLHCEEYGWMAFNGKYWQSKRAESQLDRCIVKVLLARRTAAVKTGKKDFEPLVGFAKPNANRLNGCKYLFMSIVPALVSSFDNDPDLLNCNNGVLNLKTGELIPHDREQRFTYCIPINYNPDANFEPWVTWLREALGGGADVLKYVKRALGYSLTGHTSEECLFYLYGPLRAGKGTFTETIQSMLGSPLAKGTEFNTFAAKRDPDASNFDLAGLKPTRFVSAGESDEHTRLSARRIKALTGGDTVRCCFKFKDHFEYKPQYKIWLASNHAPRSNPLDDALWGRLKIITFPKSYYGKEDKTLKIKMLSTENLEGVLCWAVQGAIDWYASLPKGLDLPPSVAEDTQKHREDNDTILRFQRDCVEDGDPSDGDFLPTSVLTEVYLRWCELTGHEPDKRELLGRMKEYQIRRRLSPETLKKNGYDGAIELPDGKKMYRGYPDLKITSEVLDEYFEV